MNNYPSYPYYTYKEQCLETPVSFPPQHQDKQPGMEYKMDPLPIFDNPSYKGSEKLKGKTAIISGGDSGIGRAVAVAFAKEGANVVVTYYNERKDAQITKDYIEKLGGKCHLYECDLRNPDNSDKLVKSSIKAFGDINILVNNCGVQFVQENILNITNEQLHNTFCTNIYSFFYLTKAVLPYLTKGDTIINTTSVTAYNGNEKLLDYSATKGAIVTFTRSLSLQLVKQGIRVNGVAPGPIWTPLQPASYSPEDVSMLGTDTPMKRAGQPFELAPTYVYLACDDSAYVSGQILHVNGGEMVDS